MAREADMAKKIAVLLDEMVHEHEFIYPYYRLKEAGFESVSVATEKRVYKGKFGVPFTPDMLIADVTPGEFDGVVVPGGYAPDFLRRSKAMLSLVGEMNDKGQAGGDDLSRRVGGHQRRDRQRAHAHQHQRYQRRHVERRGNLGRPVGCRRRQPRHVPVAGGLARLHA